MASSGSRRTQGALDQLIFQRVAGACRFSLREGASEAREQMDVVFHAAHEEGRAIELFGDAAEIRVERVARGFVAQERAAVFGGEDQMNVNGGKGLWHVGRMVNCGGVCERESV